MRTTEVASAGTEFEAELIAEHLRGEGIAVQVLGPDALLTAALGRWRVVTPEAERARAVESIVALRREHAVPGELAACPACGYSLEGLAEPDRCPECGLSLSGFLEPDIHRGLASGPKAPVAVRARPALWLGFGLCLGVGLATVVGLPLLWVRDSSGVIAVPALLLFLLIPAVWMKSRRRKRRRG